MKKVQRGRALLWGLIAAAVLAAVVLGSRLAVRKGRAAAGPMFAADTVRIVQERPDVEIPTFAILTDPIEVAALVEQCAALELGESGGRPMEPDRFLITFFHDGVETAHWRVDVNLTASGSEFGAGNYVILNDGFDYGYFDALFVGREPPEPTGKKYESLQAHLTAHLSGLFDAAYLPYYDTMRYGMTDYEETVTADGDYTATFLWTMYWISTRHYDAPSDIGKEQMGNFTAQATAQIGGDGLLDLDTLQVLVDTSVRGPSDYTQPIENYFPKDVPPAYNRMEDWRREVVSDAPGATHVRFYSANATGTERVALELYNMAETADVDGDGHAEILEYIQGERKSIGVHSLADDSVCYLDIAEEVGAVWADYMGNVGNVETEYKTCFMAGDDSAGDNIKIYRFENGQLTYVCPLDDALRK